MKKQFLNQCLMGAVLMFFGTAFSQNFTHPADTLENPPAKYSIPVRTMDIPLAGPMNIDGFLDEP